jgi:ribosomal protein S18 acetylase RimI-like enzyme
MSDSEWQSRTEENAAGVKSTCVLVFSGDDPIGMAVGALDSQDSLRAHLFAMWVSPAHRGSCAAFSLVSFVADWARIAGARVLMGHVTEQNSNAIAFYRKVGFQLLSERRPWRPDPAKDEIAMQMPL